VDLLKNAFWVLLVFFQTDLFSAPLIQKIINQSDFGFVILKHSDMSSCSLSPSEIRKNIVIDAHAVFNQPFLLEIGQPSLVLRPIYYENSQTHEKIVLTDDMFEYVPENIEQAFIAWKKNTGSRKKQTAQEWFDGWVGKDVTVTPYTVSIFGYLNNWSRVVVKNSSKKKPKRSVKDADEWIKFAKGIFSKEVLELEIDQSKHRGVFGFVQMFHGEGGVCIDGAVERI
jgi:hypothetical protein